MNNCERTMLDILRKGKECHGYCAVKAEFESEGTRIDELLRLVELTRRADLKLEIKIGGCEAIRDLLEARQVGADYIVAPMIETPYALSKYIDAKNRVYSLEERKDVRFLFNVETISAYHSIEEMATIASAPEGVQGIVFGRVDFAMSRGLGREGIETDDITHHVIQVGRLCKRHGLELLVGGSISLASLPHLKAMQSEHLTRFETRKVVFQAEAIQNERIHNGLLQAVYFELLWLRNKRDYYGAIHAEDAKRIEMLEGRLSAIQGSTP